MVETKLKLANLAILIPVLKRPQNILSLAESVKNSTSDYELLFIASPDDEEEICELECYDQSYIVMDASYENKGDYAKKINKGFESVEAEWYFLGADDIKFHPGWFENAMITQKTSGACVIGTNDLGNPAVVRGQHSTHSLVLRDYVLECGTIDQPGKVLHEGYRHNFVDSEFVETAKWRGAWAFAKNSVVEHLHPNWKKGKEDSVYELGKSGFEIDKSYFSQRKKLWP